MTTATPTVNGRVIGLAHYAGRAVLESVLEGYGITFQQSVTLRLVAIAPEPVLREGLVGQVTDALKIDEADVHAVIEELIAGKHLEVVPQEPSRVWITDAGRELYDRTSVETGEISARIYAGIPAEDLAVAGRVLALVTERANAELAGA
ncbi:MULTISPECIES: MarR family winged helix-turn-helix transcriptional regulator [Streptomyces]|uniref:MarR family transcriptional regulator n=1 Tax=Streptomyces dengpaensis TaxID=2049881 RepID=A0ABN5HV99_9ACTN|nr:MULTISPECIES: MarR family winged helix-turn-helix transcriptional regulator [Streptomyces]AVH55047.1 MarR family transcriptional regulator [Streptomyces dengpaensis]PIB08343.1 MarR family transcriptional regulator [Streptomyces sp. HG99]